MPAQRMVRVTPTATMVTVSTPTLPTAAAATLGRYTPGSNLTSQSHAIAHALIRGICRENRLPLDALHAVHVVHQRGVP